jgi:hypothetical protein
MAGVDILFTCLPTYLLANKNKTVTGNWQRKKTRL